MVIHTDIYDIWMSILSHQVRISTLISKQGYPCKDILHWVSVEHEYPRMDTYVFMDISLQFSMLLFISMWISIDFYGYPCMDLLWILDPIIGLLG